MVSKLQILFLILILSCHSAVEDSDPVRQEIKSLHTDQAKKSYLEEIFKEDQKYRQGQSSALMLQYGKLSTQYQEFMTSSDLNDSLNLVKIKQYIDIMGHPDIDKVGELAAQTPWAVIHHSGSYEERSRYFDILHEAFKNGNIDSGAFTLYLERMYNFKYRQRFKFEGVYGEQEMIDTLINQLNLNQE